jgi:hypothetical protein
MLDIVDCVGLIGGFPARQLSLTHYLIFSLLKSPAIVGKIMVRMKGEEAQPVAFPAGQGSKSRS